MPKISEKAPKKSAASGIETAGGITSRSLSLGWSWWMPWMMKCMRRPKALSGSQWKTSRCSQYSVSVQIPIPPSEQAASCQDAVAAVDAQPLHRDDHRHEDDRRDRRVHPREEVEEFALEERRGGRELLGPLVSLHLRPMVATAGRRLPQDAGNM